VKQIIPATGKELEQVVKPTGKPAQPAAQSQTETESIESEKSNDLAQLNDSAATTAAKAKKPTATPEKTTTPATVEKPADSTTPEKPEAATPKKANATTPTTPATKAEKSATDRPAEKEATATATVSALEAAAKANTAQPDAAAAATPEKSIPQKPREASELEREIKDNEVKLRLLKPRAIELLEAEEATKA